MSSNNLNISANALTVLKKRYLKKDNDGNCVETPEKMFQRVAEVMGSAELLFGNSQEVKEEYENRFYKLMTEMRFLPNSPTLMNAGRELGQLSACFVLPIEDSMDSIFQAVKDTALIHKSGGGTGFSFSKLRPHNDRVLSTKGVSSGPLSFMKVFNVATETIKQGGTRRGANMGILRVDHPDILNFISSKMMNDSLNNFNISVAMTEAFMTALENDEEYDLINPRDGKPCRKLKASKVFQFIVNMAWNNGEPGIIFLDRINASNKTPEVGEMESTNPCGEQPLLPYESCNLGSINLSALLLEEQGKCTFNWGLYEETIRDSVRFLDNVIEANRFPLPKIEEMTKANRKIGLGIMGFSDVLFKMNIPYNSPEAEKLAVEIMSFLDDKSKECSIELAKERGSFPNFDKSVYRDDERYPCMRNATTTTIAPTGTISIIANCSSGIEPVFSLCYMRHILDGEKLLEVHPYFKEVAQKRGFYSEELMEKIACEGSIAHIDEIPEDVKRVFITSHDITPEIHINIQAAFQRHTDNAVSKTVNFANSATPEEVEKVYRLAYKSGCKGVTIYRDGSRSEQVLNLKTEKKEVSQEIPEQSIEPRKQEKNIRPRTRPELTAGITKRYQTGCGKLYVTVNFDESGICEVFTTTGRSGGCPSQSEAVSRIISLALRAGVPAESVVKMLHGIRCLSTLSNRHDDHCSNCLSCPDAIAKAIDELINRNVFHSNDDNLLTLVSKEPERKQETSKNVSQCPECKSAIEHEGGCVICRNCGFSKCG